MKDNMREIIVENYSSYARCRFHEIIYPSQTPKFTYTFKPGCYAFLGQIDNGGWAFTYSLTPLDKEDVCLCDTPIFIGDGKRLPLDYLRSISCYLGYYQNTLSAKERFAQIEKLRGLKRPLEDIKEMFRLTNARFDKPLNMTGNEVWRITAALGYAENKTIFCYPWRTNNQLKSHIFLIKKMSEIFEKEDKYLFIPVENGDLVKDNVRNIIDLSQPQTY